MTLVGRNIDAFCSRCRLTLAHIVLYEVGGQVRGVKCKTCGAEHRYHGPAPEMRRSVPAVRRSGAAPAARTRTVRPADARLWEMRTATLTPDVVIWAYKLTERFEKGDVIAHPLFGRGFVESIKGDDGMEVLFGEGRKRLAMNRPDTNPA